MGVLRLSFGVSILVHAAVIGWFLLAGFGSPKPVLRQVETPIKLVVVAASPELEVLGAASPPSTPPPAARRAPEPPPVAEPPTQSVSLPPEPAAELSKPDLPVHLAELTESPALHEQQIATAPPANALASEMTDERASESSQEMTSAQGQPGARTDPTYLNTPEPAYPLAAQRRHQAGTVWLTVRVTASGRAARVELTRSSGFPLLDEAAKAAVRRWEFEPARVGAQAVASIIEIPVHFKLRR